MFQGKVKLFLNGFLIFSQDIRKQFKCEQESKPVYLNDYFNALLIEAWLIKRVGIG